MNVNGVEKMREIEVYDAYQNNLKHIDLRIPYYKLNVVTGPSGSGKSSLVYDTIFAESQRLMYDSMVNNTFGVKLLQKPYVKEIRNLCAAICISQQSYNFNPNSTVGSFSGLSGELRSLYSCVARYIDKRDYSPKDFNGQRSRYRCKECEGTGRKLYLSLDSMFEERSWTLRQGGINYFSGAEKSFEKQLLFEICDRYGIDLDTPISEMSKNDLDVLLYGGDNNKYKIRFERGSKKNCQKTLEFNGVYNELNELYKRVKTPMIRNQISRYLKEDACDCCGGAGLTNEIVEYKICGNSFYDSSKIELTKLLEWCENVKENYKKTEPYKQIEIYISHIVACVEAINKLNIAYLSIDRTIPSLSGGEYQRLRIAKQLSGELIDVLYILDEPCKGLHPINVAGVIKASKDLVDKGNTVIAIEHNDDYIINADKVFSIGPESGPNGGEIVTYKKDDLNDYDTVEKSQPKDYFEFKGISVNNIVKESCRIPICSVTFVTGGSGAGKSSLVCDAIYESLSKRVNNNCEKIIIPFEYNKVYLVDQKPMGKNSRSTLISYLKIYDEVRKVFSGISYKGKKYPSSSFGTNTKGGRCENCCGSGVIPIDDGAFSDSYIVCEECNGNRFQDDILEIKYRGYNINDVLNMDVIHAIDLFSDNKKITAMLKCIDEIGMSYLRLGQLSMNLSGGESQRLKLARALGEDKGNQNIYILDEPTSGLSPKDIHKLELIIHRLKDQGNTIIIIDHNVSFIDRNADYLIDFGILGGSSGGKILHEGDYNMFQWNNKKFEFEKMESK